MGKKCGDCKHKKCRCKAKCTICAFGYCICRIKCSVCTFGGCACSNRCNKCRFGRCICVVEVTNTYGGAACGALGGVGFGSVGGVLSAIDRGRFLPGCGPSYGPWTFGCYGNPVALAPQCGFNPFINSCTTVCTPVITTCNPCGNFC